MCLSEGKRIVSSSYFDLVIFMNSTYECFYRRSMKFIYFFFIYYYEQHTDFLVFLNASFAPIYTRAVEYTPLYTHSYDTLFFSTPTVILCGYFVIVSRVYIFLLHLIIPSSFWFLVFIQTLHIHWQLCNLLENLFDSNNIFYGISFGVRRDVYIYNHLISGRNNVK